MAQDRRLQDEVGEQLEMGERVQLSPCHMKVQGMFTVMGLQGAIRSIPCTLGASSQFTSLSFCLGSSVLINKILFP